MANQQILDLLKQGVNTWNKWRQEHLDIMPDLIAADLEGADLTGFHLEGADLSGVRLAGADLFGAHLTRADLSQTYLDGAIFFGADLQGADLSRAHLEEANLSGAHLEWTDLSGAHLEGAILVGAHLEGAILIGAHLEGVDLSGANLAGATLQLACFDNATRLDNITLKDEQHGVVSVADVSWGGVNLAGVDWASVKMLGDELVAHQTKSKRRRSLSRQGSISQAMSASRREKNDGKRRERAIRIGQYRAAVRANRQLAAALQARGLNEEASYFAYRAQVLQCTLWRLQRRPLKYTFSRFLYLYAGYGYKPTQMLIAYPLIVGTFASIYHVLKPVKLRLSWVGVLLYSLVTFHGRGFFPDHTSFDDLLTVLTVAEALLGLFMELSFIVLFIHRISRIGV